MPLAPVMSVRDIIFSLPETEFFRPNGILRRLVAAAGSACDFRIVLVMIGNTEDGPWCGRELLQQPL